jgi:hypothetical protein
MRIIQARVLRWARVQPVSQAQTQRTNFRWATHAAHIPQLARQVFGTVVILQEVERWQYVL